jgi:putative protease
VLLSISHPTPELLSPAGNWDCARAAVANGADAIYFGMPRFNARIRADNFSEEDLPALMEFLHKHGVRGYCAFNTLIFTDELPDAEKQLRLLDAAKVDAVIVQDIGLARMVKAIAPRIALHASTQMTITSPEGLRFARKLGLDLAVLARELSMRELERFNKGDADPLPLEVFVHGALCVAYSGQCLTSESLGQRSANRGECAQACRMPYELILDGDKYFLEDQRYLLSPQDLAAVDEIPRLIELGIKSFKIEGRLKTPEYVAAVTRVYRKAIDAVLSKTGLQPVRPAGILPAISKEGTAEGAKDSRPTDSLESCLTAEDRYSLEMTFSRGLYPGWMHGVNHQELVGARYAKKRGPFVGIVRGPAVDGVELTQMQTSVKPGDGVVFENPADTNNEQGGYIYAVNGAHIEFQRGKLDMTRIPTGTRVYKTSDPALERELKSTYKGELPIRKQRWLHLRVSGEAGKPMALGVIDGAGHIEASVESSMPLQVAQKRPFTRELLMQQLGKLGGTPFELATLEVALVGEVILPVSEVNRMRRELVELLSGTGWKPVGSAGILPVPEVLSSGRMPELPTGFKPVSQSEKATLTVLCRTMEHIEAALEAGVPRIYLDFEDIRRYADAVCFVKQSGKPTDVSLATPRIQKAGEEGFFKLIERAEPHGVLIRNLGAIEYFAEAKLPMIGDFSLNVANPLTAEFFIKEGLQRLTLSYDLNIDQVLSLLRAAPPHWFEITLHQHMPMFHMEHCVFAAFLSNGKTFLDCGRPCDRHTVKLRDRVGMEHPLKADVGCRNTLFNAVAQTGAKFYDALFTAGLRNFRVELLEESHDEAARVISLYKGLINGGQRGDVLYRELKAQSQLGVTSGTMRE